MTDARQLADKKLFPKAAEQPAERKAAREFRTVAILAALHIPLGIILFNAGFIGLLHPAIVFFIGLRWAFDRKVRIERVVLAATYIIGSEVLWRMAQLPTFWEFGKYASALIMAIALIRRDAVKIPALPLVYFVLLMPACFLTLVNNDLGEARGKISFNLSGPLLLTVSCWFFARIKFNRRQIRRLLLALIIPLLSVAFVTLFYTVSNPDIEFNTESNFATSGGFGPNQVSTMLGLGAFTAITSILLFKNSGKYNVFFLAVALLMTAQSVMTFSRGGMYTAAGAAAVVIFFQSQNIAAALKRLIPIAILSALFLLVIFPALNDFTGGKLQERFEDTGTTNRAEIIEADFQTLMENPVLGVGVGDARNYRKKFLEFKSASHTEFSRLVSEHGLFGIMAAFCLLAMSALNLSRQKSSFGRALIGGFLVWSSLFMLNAGMRLAAPAFVWGVSFIAVRQFSGNGKKAIRQIR